LEDIKIKCEISGCNAINTMQDALGSNSKFFRSFKCTARHPHLEDIGNKYGNKEKICEKNMRAILRGATEGYFPNIVSSLSIPEQNLFNWGDAIDSILKNIPDPPISLTEKFVNESLIPILRVYHSSKANQIPSAIDLINSYNNRKSSVTNLRDSEYSILSNKEPYIEKNFVKEPIDITKHPTLSKWFSSVAIIKKLTEVRVLTSFSRLTSIGEIQTQLVSQDLQDVSAVRLSKHGNNTQFLPGVEFSGEGVFFQLKMQSLRKWVNGEISRRIRKLSQSGESNIEIYNALLHTLSHAMIRAVSQVAGYNSSSIRERLYLYDPNEKERAPGFMLYTATPDSEGSLGGLVRIFETEIYEKVLHDMQENMQWCNSDPVCIETTCERGGPQNNAACHACLLLPETSCELMNQILDRALLVGTRENRNLAFLQEF
jgi:hypothetical protein